MMPPNSTDVGLLVVNDEHYIHANDLVDYLNAKAQEVYDHDIDAFTAYDLAAGEIINLITGEQ